MKLAIIAASTLIGAASLVSVPAGAQVTQTATPPVNAIARSGALPTPTQPTTPRNFTAAPSTAPASAAAAAVPNSAPGK
jgi:hypothetical protein